MTNKKNHHWIIELLAGLLTQKKKFVLLLSHLNYACNADKLRMEYANK